MLLAFLAFPQKEKKVLVLKLPAYLSKKKGLKILGIKIEGLTQTRSFKSEGLPELRKHFHKNRQKRFGKMCFLFIRNEDEGYYTSI